MVRSMQAGAKPGAAEADRAENAVFGALMAAFMGVSPFVANAAGRWADAALSRAAQARQATCARFPRLCCRLPPRTGTERRMFRIRLRSGTARTDCSVQAGFSARGAEAGSRVEVWINQAGDMVAPPMRQAEIASRVELAQGLAAAGFAAGLGVIGWLTRQSQAGVGRPRET